MVRTPKVLYFVERYAQISETYIENEILALGDAYKLRVVSIIKPDLQLLNYTLPYTMMRTREHLLQMTEDFVPSVIHGHYLTMIDRLFSASETLQTPFTLRAHSFDILGASSDKLAHWSRFANAENCLGILTFPFTVSWLAEAGFNENKLIPCYPVVNVKAFDDRSENGNAIMNTGAALPKKRMEDFIRLGSKVPQREFNLYPLGYNTRRLADYNESLGNPVNIRTPVQPRAMPAVFKNHEWLVYTACPQLKTVGWPLSVAEAQASGVGVCMANIRPDLKDYVGDCGFLYDTIDDVTRIIEQPFPEDLRERGFELAKRSDVSSHIDLLRDLWSSVA